MKRRLSALLPLVLAICGCVHRHRPVTVATLTVNGKPFLGCDMAAGESECSVPGAVTIKRGDIVAVALRTDAGDARKGKK